MHILELPQEMLEEILSYLPFPSYGRVCEEFHYMCKKKEPDVLLVPLSQYIEEGRFDLAGYRISLSVPLVREIRSVRREYPYGGTCGDEGIDTILRCGSFGISQVEYMMEQRGRTQMDLHLSLIVSKINNPRVVHLIDERIRR